VSTYLAALDLLADAPTRLAQLTSPEAGPVLDAEILGLQLAGADLTSYAYEPAAMAAAAAAQTLIERAIGRAESALDAAARDRYALPLAPLDDLVTGILHDLAWFYCYRSGVPDDVAKKAEQARADLGRIQRGELHLTAAAIGSGTGVGMADWSAPADTFPAADLDAFGGA